ncbi:LysE family translocator [Streptomyces sp. LX-29]|uniref:LysE family translocator n=1 Tax=Streptomyces sp. LX-29 TaxID=2900152 RepID=UPI00240E36B8|nr:LysE family translocator [Streptomyces sp. LX-29]WFB08326.1 LysE family translocator [Streptomyces sp. LX-29]
MDVGAVAAFFAVDLLLVCTPGADWAYTITAGLRDRSVVPAVSGLVAGYAAHTLLALCGLALLVSQSASLLTVLTVVGAGYLCWLGWQVLSSPPADPVGEGAAGSAGAAVGTGGGAGGVVALAATPWQAVWKGAGISGLNPKGLLLYFSLLPQFISPGAGWPVAAQTGLLGALHTANCAVVYLSIGMLSRTVLRTRPSAARVVTRTAGVMMLAIGAFLLVEQVAAAG